MSVSPTIARRLVSQKYLNRRNISQQRLFWEPQDPKDAANDLARRILSNELYEQRYSYELAPEGKSVVQDLRYLAKWQGSSGLTFPQRLAMFRDMISRCESRDFEYISRTGILRALRKSPMPVRPSELLRQGESVLRAHLADLKRSVPARSDTAGLEDADSIVLRLFLTAERCNLEEHRRLLRIFNAFVSRMESSGHPIGPVLASEGQRLAADSHSVPALIQYVQRAVPESDSFPARAADLAAIMSSVRLWLIEEFEDKGLTAALSSLFAKSDPEAANVSHTTFRSQFVSLDPAWRWDYLDILRRLSGAKEILMAWNEFQTSSRWDKLVKENSASSLAELASTLHDVIEQLLMAKEPQLAWIVVHSLGWKPKAILSKTWALLLEFPEHLTQMSEGMQEVLLQVYEERIEAIEGTLGVRWTGGEDGAHVLLDDGRDPQALVEDVNMSENVHRD